jgi:hypothetical protein
LAGDALRTREFWLISAGHGLALAIMSAVGVHFVIYVIEVLGLGVTTAATLLAVMTVASVAGQLAGGAAGDRIDKRWFAGGAMLAHAGAMALLVVGRLRPHRDDRRRAARPRLGRPRPAHGRHARGLLRAARPSRRSWASRRSSSCSVRWAARSSWGCSPTAPAATPRRSSR